MKTKSLFSASFLIVSCIVSAQEVPFEQSFSPSHALAFSRSAQDSKGMSAVVSSHRDDDLVIGDEPGETLTITQPFVLDGDLTILGDGVLNIENTDFAIGGDIFILGRGRLNVTGGSFTVIQEYIYEHDAVVIDEGELRFTDADFISSGQSWSIGLVGNAEYTMHGCDVSDGFITVALLENASAQIADSRTPGEFLCFGENRVQFSNCDLLLFWVVLPDGSIVDAALPDDLSQAAWTFDEDQPGVNGIPYAVEIDSCTDVLWGLISEEGSDATFRNTRFRAAGLMFREPDSTVVSGIANGSTHGDDILDVTGRTLRFIESEVQTWNVYASSESNVTLENCVFGEILTQDSARAAVINSVCDGTGGYVGAFQKSTLLILGSLVKSQVISRDNAVLVGAASAFTGAEIDADQSSVMLIANTPYVVEPEAHHAAVIFDVRLPSVEGFIEDIVPIPGTMRILAGPENPIELDRYAVEYSHDEERRTWLPTDGVHASPVVNGLLAEWSTTDLAPGGYGLRLTFWHNYGDSLSIDSWARLQSPVSVAQDPTLPSASRLDQNYPNPFNAVTTIPFSLPEASRVSLRIYDLKGREVETLRPGILLAGNHTLSWDASRLPGGMYTCRMQAGAFHAVRRFLLLK